MLKRQHVFLLKTQNPKWNNFKNPREAMTNLNTWCRNVAFAVNLAFDVAFNLAFAVAVKPRNTFTFVAPSPLPFLYLVYPNLRFFLNFKFRLGIQSLIYTCALHIAKGSTSTLPAVLNWVTSSEKKCDTSAYRWHLRPKWIFFFARTFF